MSMVDGTRSDESDEESIERTRERDVFTAADDPSRRLMTDGGEEEAEDEEEEAEADEDEESEEDEEESEDEEEAEDEESEGDEDEESDDEEDGEEGEEDKEGGHDQDAEEVYDDDEATGVLHLDLDGLYLDLLGLEVNLNEVTLDLSARPGDGNLLGNLLSAVAGLGDGGLGDLLPDGLSDLLPDGLSDLLPDGEDLFGGDGDGEDGEGPLAGAASSARETASNVLSELPIEEFVGQLARELINQLLGEGGSELTDAGPLGDDEEDEEGDDGEEDEEGDEGNEEDEESEDDEGNEEDDE